MKLLATSFTFPLCHRIHFLVLFPVTYDSDIRSYCSWSMLSFLGMVTIFCRLLYTASSNTFIIICLHSHRFPLRYCPSTTDATADHQHSSLHFGLWTFFAVHSSRSAVFCEDTQQGYFLYVVTLQNALKVLSTDRQNICFFMCH
jgi:hypothetical protein